MLVVIYVKKLILKLIESYQKTPHNEKKCRFIPTCSAYAHEAYTRFNIFYATFLSVKRILKCNPMHKMAYDPVPEKGKPKYDTLEETLAKIYYEKELDK